MGIIALTSASREPPTRRTREPPEAATTQKKTPAGLCSGRRSVQ